MEPIVPLVSTSTVGPLGLKHLPRLWAKTLLAAHGRLPTGYKACEPGFDTMLLDGVGVDVQATKDFIFEHRPSYLVFERWIQSQPEADLSEENIARVNRCLTERRKTFESRLRMLAENGLPEDTPIEDSIMLNNLDDWREFYLALNK